MKTNINKSYLMENDEEITRLVIKTDPDVVAQQATWSGIKPGLRVLDAGCGPGKTTSLLHNMINPGGSILGIDYSSERIHYASDQFGKLPELEFRVHDLRETLDSFGQFDLIWVRFVLEYHLAESELIVRNLTDCLKPGGTLCLLDLDHNCLNHYELSRETEKMLLEIRDLLQKRYDFDPYAGRKLYAYLYDQGYEQIEVDMMPHHLIYGKMRDEVMFNWLKKLEMASGKAQGLFEEYPGGHDAFFQDFVAFLQNPRRFTYTPVILCKGKKPLLNAH